jgi:hypothetical protein
MVNQGLEVVPIGIYEAGGSLCINFGPHYKPGLDADLPPTEVDHMVSQIVMSHIALLLPPRLRGEF